MKVNRVWSEENLLVEIEMDDGSNRIYRKYGDDIHSLEQLGVCTCCYAIRSSKCEYIEEEIRDVVAEGVYDFKLKNS